MHFLSKCKIEFRKYNRNKNTSLKMKIFDLRNNKKWLVLVIAILWAVVPEVSGEQKDKKC